jgi:hypothetical protein
MYNIDECVYVLLLIQKKYKMDPAGGEHKGFHTLSTSKCVSLICSITLKKQK